MTAGALLRPSRLMLIAGLFGLVVLACLARSAGTASAAPCPAPLSSNSAGAITIQGDPVCASLDEDFRVYCATGTVRFDYVVGGTQSIPANNTGVPCSATSGVHVLGNGGDDHIDLTAITPGAGFGPNVQNQVDGSFQNDTVVGSPFRDLISGDDGRDLIDPGAGRDTVAGGAGEDILMLRDGGADTADCGDSTDAAQADQASLDSLTGCEILDRSPESAATKAKKKCKKRHHHGCRKHKKS